MHCYASHSFTVQLPDVQVGIAKGAQEKLGSDDIIGIGTPNLIEDFSSRLEQYFKRHGGEVRFVDRDQAYFEIISSKTRGLVITGGRDWERVDITVLLLGNGPTRLLRVQADGLLASGLNPPKSNAGYDRSMEPAYAEALSLFVRSVTTQLKRIGAPLD